MQPPRSKIVVLCVDLDTVRTIAGALERSCEIVWARDAGSIRDAVTMDPAPVAALIDNAVPQVPALEVLQSIRQIRSTVRRILISDYCDLSLIVQGLHTGAAERIVYKPIAVKELVAAVGVPAAMLGAVQAAPSIRAAG